MFGHPLFKTWLKTICLIVLICFIPSDLCFGDIRSARDYFMSKKAAEEGKLAVRSAKRLEAELRKEVKDVDEETDGPGGAVRRAAERAAQLADKPVAPVTETPEDALPEVKSANKQSNRWSALITCGVLFGVGLAAVIFALLLNNPEVLNSLTEFINHVPSTIGNVTTTVANFFSAEKIRLLYAMVVAGIGFTGLSVARQAFFTAKPEKIKVSLPTAVEQARYGDVISFTPGADVPFGVPRREGGRGIQKGDIADTDVIMMAISRDHFKGDTQALERALKAAYGKDILQSPDLYLILADLRHVLNNIAEKQYEITDTQHGEKSAEWKKSVLGWLKIGTFWVANILPHLLDSFFGREFRLGVARQWYGRHRNTLVQEHVVALIKAQAHEFKDESGNVKLPTRVYAYQSFTIRALRGFYKKSVILPGLVNFTKRRIWLAFLSQYAVGAIFGFFGEIFGSPDAAQAFMSTGLQDFWQDAAQVIPINLTIGATVSALVLAAFMVLPTFMRLYRLQLSVKNEKQNPFQGNNGLPLLATLQIDISQQGAEYNEAAQAVDFFGLVKAIEASEDAEVQKDVHRLQLKEMLDQGILYCATKNVRAIAYQAIGPKSEYPTEYSRLKGIGYAVAKGYPVYLKLAPAFIVDLIKGDKLTRRMFMSVLKSTAGLMLVQTEINAALGLSDYAAEKVAGLTGFSTETVQHFNLVRYVEDDALRVGHEVLDILPEHAGPGADVIGGFHAQAQEETFGEYKVDEHALRDSFVKFKLGDEGFHSLEMQAMQKELSQGLEGLDENAGLDKPIILFSAAISKAKQIAGEAKEGTVRANMESNIARLEQERDRLVISKGLVDNLETVTAEDQKAAPAHSYERKAEYYEEAHQKLMKLLEREGTSEEDRAKLKEQALEYFSLHKISLVVSEAAYEIAAADEEIKINGSQQHKFDQAQKLQLRYKEINTQARDRLKQVALGAAGLSEEFVKMVEEQTMIFNEAAYKTQVAYDKLITQEKEWHAAVARARAQARARARQIARNNAARAEAAREQAERTRVPEHALLLAGAPAAAGVPVTAPVAPVEVAAVTTGGGGGDGPPEGVGTFTTVKNVAVTTAPVTISLGGDDDLIDDSRSVASVFGDLDEPIDNVEISLGVDDSLLARLNGVEVAVVGGDGASAPSGRELAELIKDDAGIKIELTDAEDGEKAPVEAASGRTERIPLVPEVQARRINIEQRRIVLDALNEPISEITQDAMVANALGLPAAPIPAALPGPKKEKKREARFERLQAKHPEIVEAVGEHYSDWQSETTEYEAARQATNEAQKAYMRAVQSDKAEENVIASARAAYEDAMDQEESAGRELFTEDQALVEDLQVLGPDLKEILKANSQSLDSANLLEKILNAAGPLSIPTAIAATLMTGNRNFGNNRMEMRWLNELQAHSTDGTSQVIFVPIDGKKLKLKPVPQGGTGTDVCFTRDLTPPFEGRIPGLDEHYKEYKYVRITLEISREGQIGIGVTLNKNLTDVDSLYFTYDAPLRPFASTSSVPKDFMYGGNSRTLPDNINNTEAFLRAVGPSALAWGLGGDLGTALGSGLGALYEKEKFGDLQKLLRTMPKDDVNNFMPAKKPKGRTDVTEIFGAGGAEGQAIDPEALVLLWEHVEREQSISGEEAAGDIVGWDLNNEQYAGLGKPPTAAAARRVVLNHEGYCNSLVYDPEQGAWINVRLVYGRGSRVAMSGSGVTADGRFGFVETPNYNAGGKFTGTVRDVFDASTGELIRTQYFHPKGHYSVSLSAAADGGFDISVQTKDKPKNRTSDYTVSTWHQGADGKINFDETKVLDALFDSVEAETIEIADMPAELAANLGIDPTQPIEGLEVILEDGVYSAYSDDPANFTNPHSGRGVLLAQYHPDKDNPEKDETFLFEPGAVDPYMKVDAQGVPETYEYLGRNKVVITRGNQGSVGERVFTIDPETKKVTSAIKITNEWAIADAGEGELVQTATRSYGDGFIARNIIAGKDPRTEIYPDNGTYEIKKDAVPSVIFNADGSFREVNISILPDSGIDLTYNGINIKAGRNERGNTEVLVNGQEFDEDNPLKLVSYNGGDSYTIRKYETGNKEPIWRGNYELKDNKLKLVDFVDMAEGVTGKVEERQGDWMRISQDEKPEDGTKGTHFDVWVLEDENGKPVRTYSSYTILVNEKQVEVVDVSYGEAGRSEQYFGEVAGVPEDEEVPGLGGLRMNFARHPGVDGELIEVAIGQGKNKYVAAGARTISWELKAGQWHVYVDTHGDKNPDEDYLASEADIASLEQLDSKLGSALAKLDVGERLPIGTLDANIYDFTSAKGNVPLPDGANGAVDAVRVAVKTDNSGITLLGADGESLGSINIGEDEKAYYALAEEVDATASFESLTIAEKGKFSLGKRLYDYQDVTEATATVDPGSYTLPDGSTLAQVLDIQDAVRLRKATSTENADEQTLIAVVGDNARGVAVFEVTPKGVLFTPIQGSKAIGVAQADGKIKYQSRALYSGALNITEGGVGKFELVEPYNYFGLNYIDGEEGIPADLSGGLDLSGRSGIEINPVNPDPANPHKLVVQLEGARRLVILLPKESEKGENEHGYYFGDEDEATDKIKRTSKLWRLGEVEDTEGNPVEVVFVSPEPKDTDLPDDIDDDAEFAYPIGDDISLATELTPDNPNIDFGFEYGEAGWLYHYLYPDKFHGKTATADDKQLVLAIAADNSVSLAEKTKNTDISENLGRWVQGEDADGRDVVFFTEGNDPEPTFGYLGILAPPAAGDTDINIAHAPDSKDDKAEPDFFFWSTELNASDGEATSFTLPDADNDAGRDIAIAGKHTRVLVTKSIDPDTGNTYYSVIQKTDFDPQADAPEPIATYTIAEDSHRGKWVVYAGDEIWIIDDQNNSQAAVELQRDEDGVLIGITIAGKLETTSPQQSGYADGGKGKDTGGLVGYKITKGEEGNHDSQPDTEYKYTCEKGFGPVIMDDFTGIDIGDTDSKDDIKAVFDRINNTLLKIKLFAQGVRVKCDKMSDGTIKVTYFRVVDGEEDEVHSEIKSVKELSDVEKEILEGNKQAEITGTRVEYDTTDDGKVFVSFYKVENGKEKKILTAVYEKVMNEETGELEDRISIIEGETEPGKQATVDCTGTITLNEDGTVNIEINTVKSVTAYAADSVIEEEGINRTNITMPEGTRHVMPTEPSREDPDRYVYVTREPSDKNYVSAIPVKGIYGGTVVKQVENGKVVFKAMYQGELSLVDAEGNLTIPDDPTKVPDEAYMVWKAHTISRVKNATAQECRVYYRPADKKAYQVGLETVPGDIAKGTYPVIKVYEIKPVAKAADGKTIITKEGKTKEGEIKIEEGKVTTNLAELDLSATKYEDNSLYYSDYIYHDTLAGVDTDNVTLERKNAAGIDLSPVTIPNCTIIREKDETVVLKVAVPGEEVISGTLQGIAKDGTIMIKYVNESGDVIGTRCIPAQKVNKDGDVEITSPYWESEGRPDAVIPGEENPVDGSVSLPGLGAAGLVGATQAAPLVALAAIAATSGNAQDDDDKLPDLGEISDVRDGDTGVTIARYKTAPEAESITELQGRYQSFHGEETSELINDFSIGRVHEQFESGEKTLECHYIGEYDENGDPSGAWYAIVYHTRANSNKLVRNTTTVIPLKPSGALDLTGNVIAYKGRVPESAESLPEALKGFKIISTISLPLASEEDSVNIGSARKLKDIWIRGLLGDLSVICDPSDMADYHNAEDQIVAEISRLIRKDYSSEELDAEHHPRMTAESMIDQDIWGEVDNLGRMVNPDGYNQGFLKTAYEYVREKIGLPPTPEKGLDAMTIRLWQRLILARFQAWQLVSYDEYVERGELDEWKGRVREIRSGLLTRSAADGLTLLYNGVNNAQYAGSINFTDNSDDSPYQIKNGLVELKDGKTEITISPKNIIDKNGNQLSISSTSRLTFLIKSDRIHQKPVKIKAIDDNGNTIELQAYIEHADEWHRVAFVPGTTDRSRYKITGDALNLNEISGITVTFPETNHYAIKAAIVEDTAGEERTYTAQEITDMPSEFPLVAIEGGKVRISAENFPAAGSKDLPEAEVDSEDNQARGLISQSVDGFLEKNGADVEVSFALPAQFNETGANPLVIITDSAGGSVSAYAEIKQDADSKEWTGNWVATIPMARTGDFDPTDIRLAQVRFNLAPEAVDDADVNLGQKLLQSGAVALVIGAITGSLLVLIRAFWKIVYIRKNKKYREATTLAPAFAEAKKKDDEPKTGNDEATLARSDKYSGQIRGWVDKIRVDFRYKGKQEEDEGTFLPAPRKSEPWEFHDPDAVPRFDSANITKGIVFSLVAAVLYMLDERLASILPFAFLFMAYKGFAGLLNWRKASRALGLSAVFLIIQVLVYNFAPGSDNLSWLISSSLLLTIAAIGVYMLTPFVKYLHAVRNPENYIIEQRKRLNGLKKILEGIGNDKAFMDKAEYLTRPMRTRYAPEGEKHEGGVVVTTPEFGTILTSAIEEIEAILQRKPSSNIKIGETIRASLLVPVTFCFSVIIAGSVALWAFSALSVLSFSILSAAAVVFGFIILTNKVIGILKQEMLIYPAFDMKKIFSENYRIIYNPLTERGLKALDVRKFLVEIRAATDRKMQNPDNSVTLQACLDDNQDALETASQSADARGPLNAWTLIKFEKWPEKLKMFWRVGLLLGGLGLAATVISLFGIVAIQEVSDIVSSGFHFSWSNLTDLWPANWSNNFEHQFGWELIGKKPLLNCLALSTGQVFVSMVILGSLALFSAKFYRYFMGKFTKLYPGQEVVTKWHYIKYTTGFIVPLGIMILLGYLTSLAGPFGLALGGWGVLTKTILGAISAWSGFMLLVGHKAKHKYKAIASDDKLFNDPTDPAECEKSQQAFVNTVIRYIADNKELFNKVTTHYNNNKDKGEDWKDGLDNNLLMKYEKLFGKGTVPSGKLYTDISRKAMETAYEGLTKEEILDRMSGSGFNELKAWLVKTRNQDIDANGQTVQLWHAHKDASSLPNVSEVVLRDFLKTSPNERKIVMMADFLPRTTPWIVVVDPGDALDNLIGALIKFRYPLNKIKFIFAGESWDDGTQDAVRKKKVDGDYPPHIDMRAMASREDNLGAGSRMKTSWWARLLKLEPEEPAQPYTKPGANTAALAASDGTFGIIYDTENIPNPNQLLQFVLGTMDGVSSAREFAHGKFDAALEGALGDVKDENTLVGAKSIVSQTVKAYMDSLSMKEREVHHRFNFKTGKNLKRHLNTFVNFNLNQLFRLISKDPKLLSTAMIWQRIQETLGDKTRDQERKELIGLYITLCNMPGYGEAATEYIKSDRTPADVKVFVKVMIIGEFRRINEPKNGQGRLAKVNNALHRQPGQVAAYMFGEYASWYTAGYDDGVEDKFIPLGGTTGYFCTDPVEDIDWTKITEDEKDKLSLSNDDVDYIAEHYRTKNRILSVGGWDEFQVAEDYMLGMVLWWHGFNVAPFYSLTPEDPAGFESELSFKYRPKQISRWVKGYIIGLVKVAERGNFRELVARKGWKGVLLFFVPTLSSAIHPLLFRIARVLVFIWLIYFIPLPGIADFVLNNPVLAPIATNFDNITGIGTFMLNAREAVGTIFPQLINWVGIYGPLIVFVPNIIHRYFTVRGIFKGVDDYLCQERVLDEYEKVIAKLDKEISKSVDPAERKELIRVKIEFEKRDQVVRTGSLKEARGVISPHGFVVAMGALTAACIAIAFAPTLIWGLITLVGVTALFYVVVMGTGFIYINSGNNQRERSVRAMRFRAAMPNLFIDFYHMIYLPGNDIAWKETIDGGRIGYWWRTPRPTEILKEAKERLNKQRVTVADRQRQTDSFQTTRLSTEMSSPEKEDPDTLEKDLEPTRLTFQLWSNYGFMGGLFLLVSLGLRWDLQNYLFANVLADETKRGLLTESLSWIQVNYPLVLLITGSVIALLFVGVWLFKVIKWRQPITKTPWQGEKESPSGATIQRLAKEHRMELMGIRQLIRTEGANSSSVQAAKDALIDEVAKYRITYGDAISAYQGDVSRAREALYDALNNYSMELAQEVIRAEEGGLVSFIKDVLYNNDDAAQNLDEFREARKVGNNNEFMSKFLLMLPDDYFQKAGNNNEFISKFLLMLPDDYRQILFDVNNGDSNLVRQSLFAKIDYVQKYEAQRVLYHPRTGQLERVVNDLLSDDANVLSDFRDKLAIDAGIEFIKHLWDNNKVPVEIRLALEDINDGNTGAAQKKLLEEMVEANKPRAIKDIDRNLESVVHGLLKDDTVLAGLRSARESGQHLDFITETIWGVHALMPDGLCQTMIDMYGGDEEAAKKRLFDELDGLNKVFQEKVINDKLDEEVELLLQNYEIVDALRVAREAIAQAEDDEDAKQDIIADFIKTYCWIASPGIIALEDVNDNNEIAAQKALFDRINTEQLKKQDLLDLESEIDTGADTGDQAKMDRRQALGIGAAAAGATGLGFLAKGLKMLGEDEAEPDTSPAEPPAEPVAPPAEPVEPPAEPAEPRQEMLNLSGVNMPWFNYGTDIVDGVMPRDLNAKLNELKNNQVKITRLFLGCDLQSCAVVGDKGKLTPEAEANIRNILDAIGQKGMQVIVSLSDGAGLSKPIDKGRKSSAATIAMMEKEKDVLFDIVSKFSGHSAVYAWETMNEPEELIKIMAEQGATDSEKDSVETFNIDLARKLNTAGVKWTIGAKSPSALSKNGWLAKLHAKKLFTTNFVPTFHWFPENFPADEQDLDAEIRKIRAQIPDDCQIIITEASTKDQTTEEILDIVEGAGEGKAGVLFWRDKETSFDLSEFGSFVVGGVIVTAPPAVSKRLRGTLWARRAAATNVTEPVTVTVDRVPTPDNIIQQPGAEPEPVETGAAVAP